MASKHYIKIIISLALLVLIYFFLSVEDIIASFLSVPWYYAVVVILGYTVGQIISVFKWQIILKSSGILAPFSKVFVSYFTGMFVNCFGLGILGGDVARGVLVSSKGKKTLSLATVVADRMHGLAVLALLGTICAIFFETRIDRVFFVLLAIIELGIIFTWIYGPKFLLKILPHDSSLYGKITQASGAFPRDIKTLTLITLASLIFHIIQVSLHAVMAMALGVYIPWPLLFATIPFVNIITSLPFSWNGLGVREAAYIFFLVPIALVGEQAVVFGVIWLLAVTINGLAGGVVAFVSGSLSLLKNNKAREMRLDKILKEA